MAAVDHDVTLELAGVGAVSGRLTRVATGWCLLRGAGQDWVVRLEAVAAVQGASDRAVPELAWPPVARLGLGAALRRLADAAEPCSLHLTDGRRHDGTLLRVGSDFVELATGAAGRAGAGRPGPRRSRPVAGLTCARRGSWWPGRPRDCCSRCRCRRGRRPQAHRGDPHPGLGELRGPHRTRPAR